MQSIALAGLAWARVQDAGQPAVWPRVADAVGIGLLIIAMVKTRRMRRLQKKLDELVSLSRPRH